MYLNIFNEFIFRWNKIYIKNLEFLFEDVHLGFFFYPLGFYIWYKISLIEILHLIMVGVFFFLLNKNPWKTHKKRENTSTNLVGAILMIMNGLSNPNKKIFRPDKAIHIARKSSQKKKRKKKKPSLEKYWC